MLFWLVNRTDPVVMPDFLFTFDVTELAGLDSESIQRLGEAFYIENNYYFFLTFGLTVLADASHRTAHHRRVFFLLKRFIKMKNITEKEYNAAISQLKELFGYIDANGGDASIDKETDRKVAFLAEIVDTYEAEKIFKDPKETQRGKEGVHGKNLMNDLLKKIGNLEKRIAYLESREQMNSPIGFQTTHTELYDNVGKDLQRRNQNNY